MENNSSPARPVSNDSHQVDGQATTAEQTPTANVKAAAGRASILGAMFLMATSAIGPGFLTQTSVFTVKMGAAFAFAIVLSIIVDIAIQLNVWRVLAVSGKRANELGNTVVPYLGWFLGALVFIGGLVFNIGNIAGAGLGMNAMFGIDAKIGGLISAVIAILIFSSKKAGMALDRLVVLLGAVMILLMLYVAITAHPPVGEALKQSVMPEKVDFLVITTLIGGTVGGYITFAGAHRMIDSGHVGPEAVKDITRASVLGIVITGILRVLLFLAILGVVATGVTLAQQNTAADAFRHAAGDIGLRAFGVVLWSAALTSVIGAAYTSITFVTKQTTNVKYRNIATAVFILVCTVIYLVLNQTPQGLLVFAGAFNGLILPVGFALVLWVAAKRKDLLHGYQYPKWLLVIGAAAWLLTIFMGVKSLTGLSALWG
ncbi:MULTISPECIES: NRAMP family divalent metal transporter [Corynebacterium]|uniref:Membrane protein n=1 Tax=Corynebacterium auriscanis TaxID=99807 RepID=A0A0A2DIU5_9CORY|nr:membrane protein [Corynebacterium auriscanis]WJY72420.1 manganese transport protein MntH [Corynebacterium auriscanis]